LGHVSATSHPSATRAVALAMLVLSGLQLMVVLDGTVANLALAPLQSDLGLSDAGRNWVLTSYALAFGGLMLLGGRLGDSYGRKRMFMGGVGLFTLASLLCGLATGEAMLIGARALQGVGAAVASPTALALVATTFAAGPARNRAIAVFAAMTGVGSIAGLILGGALTQVSWRWIFLINVPIGVLIVVLAAIALRETVSERLALDVPGAVLATLGCTGLVFGLTEGPELGWASPSVIGAIVAGFVLLQVAKGSPEFAITPGAAGTFASNGYGALSPGGYSLGAAFLVEVVLTAFFLVVIMGATHHRAPAGFAPIAIGLALTLIHLISIPVTNTSVNPARSTGVALFAGSGALSQLWLFWVAPIIGALLGGAVYRWLEREETAVPIEGEGEPRRS